ncbi:MAG TPA: DUF4838 domain-containing protein [Opitutales bacterium]|nr:DUF4838 domain-containing protein [Opitutales bacterium]
MKSTWMAFLGVCSLPLFAEEIKIIDNGVAKCRIVVAENASRPEKFGASEIAKYFLKITGCGELNGECPITIAVQSNTLSDDGFVMDASSKGVSITGGSPRGALFGCYWFLRKYAGMRWLVPGEDGEYCVHAGRTIAVPVGTVVQNPYQPIRTFGGLTSDEFHLWCARNGMQSSTRQVDFAGNDERGLKRKARLEDLAVCGVGREGHVLTEYMIGWGQKGETEKQVAEKLYAVHPEYFPMIGGKRKLTWGPYDPNPCISNPELLDRMAAQLLDSAGAEHGSDENLIIGNNDTSIWCGCETCRALDNPAMAGTRGARSDRFWYMVNGLAKRVWRTRPDVKLGAWAYQDFWYPPTLVKIDPRLRVLISFNNQCWRHSVDDPKCAVNGEYRKIFGLWKATGLQVYNRDEIADEGSPGRYLPAEYVLYRNMLANPSLGCSGDNFFVYSPFPEYLKWAAKWPPYYGKNYGWRAMWQTAWITSQIMWDEKQDFAALYEECNSLYYGKAWKGGMKDFRRYLTECFTNTVGCIGYGSGAPIGKCLDFPGSEEKLKVLLDKAIVSAKAAGDERALKHLETDKEIFSLTWVKDRKQYLENYKECDVFKRKGEITVDGVLDEADWKDAQTIGNFKHKYETLPLEPAKEPTEAKVTYDLDHLYIGVTVFEPEMANIIAGKPSEVNRDSGWDKLGDHIELFYQFPDMYEKAFHLAINSEGAIIDGIQKSASDRDITFETKAKYAIRKGADRWTLEIAIPCDEIGSKCMEGMNWRLNVARMRVVSTQERKGWATSACNGHFHGASNFIHLKLK